MAKRRGKRAAFVWKNRAGDTGRATSRDAQTASSASGCAVVFFAIASLVLLVLVSTTAFYLIVPTWEIRSRFAEAEGEIVASRIRETFNERATFYPELLIRFTPAGLPAREVWGYEIPERGFSRHASAWEVVDRLPNGKSVRCWYDPADPQQVTLAHEWKWNRIIVLLVPLLILAGAIYGLRQAWRRWGISPEASARTLDSPELHHILLFIGSGLILFGGLILSSVLFETLVPEFLAATTYVQTEGEIVDSRLLVLKGSESNSFEPEFKIRYQTPAFADPIETWCYRASDSNSGDRNKSQQILDSYPKGGKFPCWYDPERPHWVVLDASVNSGTYFLLAVPLLVMTPGAAMVFFAIQGLRHQTLDAPDIGRTGFPSVEQRWAFPRIKQPSAGRWLTYRMTERGSLWREFWLLVVFSLGWNVVAGTFATAAIMNRQKGNPEWFLTIFSSGLVLIGALIVLGTVRMFFMALRTPAAVLELSAWPLETGKSCKFHLTQGGSRPLQLLTLDATCQESTTFYEGTALRTETADIYTFELLRREADDLVGAMPFEAELAWQLPAFAMHSFQSKRNSVTWRLTIVGTFANGEKIQSEFVVPVRPGGP